MGRLQGEATERAVQLADLQEARRREQAQLRETQEALKDALTQLDTVSAYDAAEVCLTELCIWIMRCCHLYLGNTNKSKVGTVCAQEAEELRRKLQAQTDALQQLHTDIGEAEGNRDMDLALMQSRSACQPKMGLHDVSIGKSHVFRNGATAGLRSWQQHWQKLRSTVWQKCTT